MFFIVFFAVHEKKKCLRMVGIDGSNICFQKNSQKWMGIYIYITFAPPDLLHLPSRNGASVALVFW